MATIFFIISGIFAILGSILNWDFFFRATFSSIFVSFLGRTGARIFYFILGVFIIFMSFFV